MIGAAKDGWTLAFGSDVPDTLASELRAAFDVEPPAADPAEQPALASHCKSFLDEALGSVELLSGPCYVLSPETSFSSDVAILRSDEEVPDGLRDQDLERINWTAEEWPQLLDGELGAWAFVVNGDRVVSMCHSARLVDQGAEAGTWTDPSFRGRGYAAAATAAWASLLGPSWRHLFYSTSANNLSSRRVVARLDLPLIGWMWKIAASGERQM